LSFVQDIVDSLGFTQKEQNDVFKLASSLMQVSAKPVKRQVSLVSIFKGRLSIFEAYAGKRKKFEGFLSLNKKLMCHG
jgi:hypothetical protein